MSCCQGIRICYGTNAVFWLGTKEMTYKCIQLRFLSVHVHSYIAIIYKNYSKARWRRFMYNLAPNNL